HPSTPKFIVKELLQRFVDENPPQTMTDAVVAAWNNPANPHGVGDLREVLRAVLAQQAFLSPDGIGNKIKDPFEHVVSALRAVRIGRASCRERSEMSGATARCNTRLSRR